MQSFAASTDPFAYAETDYVVRDGTRTMTGELILAGNPTSLLGATPKQYVDGVLSGVTTGFVAKAGDTMTGRLTLSADPLNPLHAVTKQFVDTQDALKVAKAGDTMTGELIVKGGIGGGYGRIRIDDDGGAFNAGLTFRHGGVDEFSITSTSNALDIVKGGVSSVLHVLKSDGLTRVFGDPVDALGVATKQYVDNTTVSLAGDTMTGDLMISAANGSLVLRKNNVANVNQIYGQLNTIPQWLVRLGDATLGDLNIYRFDDAGNLVDMPLNISRATGRISLAQDPVGLLEAVTKQYVDNTTVSLSGDTMTGPLTVTGSISASSSIISNGGGIRSDNFIMSAVNATDGLYYFGLSALSYMQFAGGAFHLMGGSLNMGGDLWINKSTPRLTLNAALTTEPAELAFSKVNRTYFTARISASTNGDFAIRSYDDSGVLQPIGPFSISRSTNATSMYKVNIPTAVGLLPASTGIAGLNLGVTLNTVGASFRPADDSGLWLCHFENAAGAGVGTIVTNGTATAYNTSSDAALKEDLKSFDAGNIIDRTEVYDFAWKSTKERAYGVIAQQANEVYPQAVTHSKAVDADEKNNIPKRDEWWGIDYSKYVPVLLQELKALRARVAQLEGGITSRPA